MRQRSLKPLGPVEAVAGVRFAPVLVEVQLHAVAVVLDLVQVATRRGLAPQGRKLGLDEARHPGRTLNHTQLETNL